MNRDDSQNRTAGDIRHYFDKFGRNLGQNGCVSFMFDRKGIIVIEDEDLDEDKLMEDVMEASGDFKYEDGIAEIVTMPNDFPQCAMRFIIWAIVLLPQILPMFRRPPPPSTTGQCSKNDQAPRPA